MLLTVMYVAPAYVQAADPVEDAKALLRAGRYGEALPILQKSAAKGNAEGELYLGLMFQNGWGVAQDYTQARQWSGITGKRAPGMKKRRRADEASSIES